MQGAKLRRMSQHDKAEPRKARIEPEDLWPEEWVAWFHLTPQERWHESNKLRQIFLDLGGSLDPEPDTQSPFYDPQEQRARSADGRSGWNIIRRSGV